MRILLGAASFLLGSTIATAAFALQQPDGTPIPTTPSLQTLFNGRGESINVPTDAATVPETFTPTCALTFTVLQRNAGYMNSFGWYNVTGTKPAPNQLHEFLSCNDAVGTTKVLAIKNDPAYLGGEIGFYQAAGPGCPTPSSNQNLFFSQKAFNPDGSQMNPFIHLLTFNSTATPKAFYFAWEDLLAGGDNDFDDLTTFVTGITCTGGGGACDTGQQGVCGAGTLQCQAGVLTCVGHVTPGTEMCDGFDNDCNGSIDEGNLCQPGFVCDKGSCVHACGTGEFACPGTLVCDASGFCVDPLCANVSCDAGKKCVAGQCLGPCDNVVCPHGQTCQLGACVNPCGPLMCDTDQVCEAGVCVDKCQCRGCNASETCQMDGHCIETACVGSMCGAGSHCEAGMCVDDCSGANCPLGQTCQMGQCVATNGQGGAGGGGGSGFTSGSTGSGTSAGGSSQGGAGSGSGGSGGSTTSSSSGCGCTVPETDLDPSAWMVVAAGLGLFASRRRTSRAAR